MTHWMPLALIWLHRFSATLKVRDAIAVALLAAAQLYSSMYYGVFFALYAGAGARHAPARRAAAVAAAARAGGVGAGAGGRARRAARAALPGRPGGQGRSRRGRRPGLQRRSVGLFPRAPAKRHLRRPAARRSLSGAGAVSRHAAPRAVGRGARAAGRRDPPGVCGRARSSAFDVSLGFNGVTYKHLYRWLLPIRGLRVPARMSIVLAISLAVLAAFGARRLLRSRSGPPPAGPPSSPRSCSPPPWTSGRRSSFTASGGSRRRSTTRSRASRSCSPSFRPASTSATSPTRVPFMYFSIWHWLPMINGYSGFTPPSYEPLMEGLRDFPAPRDDRSAEVERRHSRDGQLRVVCHRLRADPGGDRRLAGVSPRRRGQWEGQPVRLYELVR